MKCRLPRTLSRFKNRLPRPVSKTERLFVMSLSRFAIQAVACGCLAVAVPGVVRAGGSYGTHGSEYAITGNWPGDQVHPQLAVSAGGGYIVWEDNVTDGNGLGI